MRGGRHADDALIYAMLSVTRIEEEWSGWRMRSNYSTGNASGERRWRIEQKKDPRIADERQKIDCENLRIYPFRPSRTRKEGAFNFQARFMTAIRENWTRTGESIIYNGEMDARRRDNNLQWTLCCRSITAIGGIYSRDMGGEDERYINTGHIQVSIGELIQSFKWIS